MNLIPSASNAALIAATPFDIAVPDIYLCAHLDTFDRVDRNDSFLSAVAAVPSKETPRCSNVRACDQHLSFVCTGVAGLLRAGNYCNKSA